MFISISVRAYTDAIFTSVYVLLLSVNLNDKKNIILIVFFLIILPKTIKPLWQKEYEKEKPYYRKTTIKEQEFNRQIITIEIECKFFENQNLLE